LQDGQIAELRQAIADYQVIFFRDQVLDFEAAAGRPLFRRTDGHSGVAGLKEHPLIVAIHADADSSTSPGELAFRPDLRRRAAMGSILNLPTVRSRRDTLFSSMYAAYEPCRSDEGLPEGAQNRDP